MTKDKEGVSAFASVTGQQRRQLGCPLFCETRIVLPEVTQLEEELYSSDMTNPFL